MWINGVKIAFALFLVLLLTGCSTSAKKENMINKRPVVISDYQGESARVVQLSNGVYIYHDRTYPGLE